ALIDLGRRNPNVVVVGADTTESIKTIEFAKAFPDRLFQLGIAEPNMISVAAGLAAAGKIPFAATYSVFGSAHTYNVIRQNVAYTNLNVKIFCSHAGVTVGPDGATHQMTADIALMRGIPRMTVLVPADGPETGKCVDAAAAMKGPVYCRFSRTNVPTITSPDDDFAIGRARVVRDGSDVTLIGCGLMVARCLEAADSLKRAGIKARVINLSTVKPLDTATIDRAARETGGIVTAEEHTVVHGIGAAIASVISGNHPVPIAMVGVQDVFGESGEAEELLRKYGLTAEKIGDGAVDSLELEIDLRGFRGERFCERTREDREDASALLAARDFLDRLTLVRLRLRVDVDPAGPAPHVDRLRPPEAPRERHAVEFC